MYLLTQETLIFKTENQGMCQLYLLLRMPRLSWHRAGPKLHKKETDWANRITHFYPEKYKTTDVCVSVLASHSDWWRKGSLGFHYTRRDYLSWWEIGHRLQCLVLRDLVLNEKDGDKVIHNDKTLKLHNKMQVIIPRSANSKGHFRQQASQHVVYGSMMQ